MKIYKTIISCILLTCLSFSIVSCGTNSPSETHPSNYEQLNQLLGKNQEVVCKELDLTKDDMKLLATGLYQTPIKVDYLGNSFDVYLTFDVHTEELYGFWYRLTYSNDSEKAANTIIPLYKKLVNIHGEPDTPETLSIRLEKHLDNLKEKLSEKNVCTLTENWEISDDFGLYLNISTDGNSNVSVQLEYKKEAEL